MKVLIISYSDIQGGAARAAFKLHKGLLNVGINSHMLVSKKSSDFKEISQIDEPLNEKRAYYDSRAILAYEKRKDSIFTISLLDNEYLVNYINNSDANLVHIHWVSNSFLSIPDIQKIKKPIIWSMHDMYAFTGGCHYDNECNKYITECYSCPILNGYEKNDLSYKIFNIKKSVFKNTQNLSFIASSSWIKKCAKNSTLLKNKKVKKIPNPIDTNIYKPLKKEDCKKYFSLNTEKKYILFAEFKLGVEKRKGFIQLLESLNLLNNNTHIELILLGDDLNTKLNDLKIKVNFISAIHNDDELINLYNSADIVVLPSLQENLSNVIMEALSCGTPVVAFDIGGNKDMIEHQRNGYLAKKNDCNDFANGIEWILNYSNYNTLEKNCRKKVLKEFAEDNIINKHIKFYKKQIKKYREYTYKDTKEILYKQTIEPFFHTIDYQTWKINQFNKNKEINFSKNMDDFYQFLLSLKDEKYILYGYGSVGKIIHSILKEKINALVDRNSNIISQSINKNTIYSPKNIVNIDYDKIIISAIGNEKKIIEFLTNELNIKIENIITLNILEN